MLRFLRQAWWLSVTVVQSIAASRLGPHRTAAERAEWAHRWAGKCLRRLGIRYSVTGTLPVDGLVVSNHLGYLDILVYAAVMRCVFVSKAEVKNWPVFGTLADLAGTVYIDRKRRPDTRNANLGISRGLAEGLPVVMFPEGTSSDGSDVLPFYPSLFEPAVESQSRVTAAYISYEVDGGSVGEDVAYWGTMTFFPHLLRLLTLGEIRVSIRFADASRHFVDRKTAASEMREDVLRLKSGATEVAPFEW